MDIRTSVRPIMAILGYAIASVACIFAVEAELISFQVALGVWLAPGSVWLTAHTIEKAKNNAKG